MAASGYTPILLYASGTATNVPLAANLTSSASGAELALNYADGKLFYKDSGGVVQVLATKGAGTIGGSNTQVQYNNAGALAGSANFTFNGTTVTMANDASISGLTVGKGAGAVSTNTAVGASALAANTIGPQNIAVGYQALYSNTTASNNTAVGYQAGYNSTGNNGIVAVGYQAGYGSTNSSSNAQSIFIGSQSGLKTTTGVDNVYVGTYVASALINTGSQNTALGNFALNGITTGGNNTAIGYSALQANTTASNNTAVGYQAGYSDTIGNNNTFIGHQAGNAVTTGAAHVLIGQGTGTSITTANYNTFVGQGVGTSTTGGYNTFIGVSNGVTGAAGHLVTSGTKNTIIGGYDGNQGGLDIRTASNYIVLSDGDGNPRFNYLSASKNWQIPYLGGTSTGRSGNPILTMSSGSTTYDGSIQITDAVANNVWWGLLNGAAYVMTNSGGVALTSGSTSWVSASDSRLKNVTGTYENALSDIEQIQPVKFTWKDDAKNKAQVGVLAQSVQAVVPEAVESLLSSEDGIEYLHVRYTELIPLMIASIKELKAEVDSLKSQLKGASA